MAYVSTAIQFEPLILPLFGSDPTERPRPGRPGPLAALLHCAPNAGPRLLIYVPGGFPGAPLTGRHDYATLAAALDKVDCSLLLLQMTTAQHTEYTRFETCANDIRTAVEWATAHGFDQIVLAGLSMGGPRVAYWNAQAYDPAVKAVVLLATIESSYLASARNWTAEQRERQDAILARCRDLVGAGQGDTIVTGELLGGPLPLSAEVYLSFLGTLEETNASTVKFAGDIRVPTVVIHSTRDFAAPPDGATAVYESLVHAPNRKLVWIENGDHQLLTTGQMADDTSHAVAEWVQETL